MPLVEMGSRCIVSENSAFVVAELLHCRAIQFV